MSTKRELTAIAKNAARECGFDLVAVAPPQYGEYTGSFRQWLERGFHGDMGYMARNVERRIHLHEVLPGIRSVICLALNYHNPGARCHDPGVGIISGYALNQDYHDVMDARMRRVVDALAAVCPGGRYRTYADTGPVLEKALAEQAGIGWIGKHTNLISRNIGSWFFLGEILTDLALAFDAPPASFCGSCRRCIDACPTGAIVAPYQLDARRCISYLTIEMKGSIPIELRPLIGNRIYGCDDCQDVCPWNRFARQTAESAFLWRGDLAAPDLVELLSLTDEHFRERFRGSPIKRIKRRGLLRNVAVALGNTKEPAAIPYLEKALSKDDPLIRAHVAWALKMIKEADLSGSEPGFLHQPR